MSLVLIPVLFRARTAGGANVVGATVRAVLTVNETDGGLVVPSSVEGITDANGEVVLQLWPNSRGVNGSQYRVVMQTVAYFFSGLVSVPEAPNTAWPVLLDTLINQPPFPSRSVAEVAQAKSQEFMLETQGFRNEAGGFRDQAETSENTATASAIAASTQAALALAAKGAAEAARDAAVAVTKRYATTAAAIADAALVDGSYFTTPSTVLGEAGIVWRKSAGVAVDTGVRLPSADLVPQSLPIESGYAWALLDSAGRAALRVKADGTVEIPKYENVQYIAKYMNPESGYVWAVVDQNDRIALGVTTAGRAFGIVADASITLAKLAADVTTRLPPSSTMPYLQQPAVNLWAFGDSLTEFNTWVERIAAYLNTPRTITRIGQGGQSSTQVAARAGGIFALLSVTGNQIPGAGAVAVTAISNRLMSCYLTAGTTNITGWLAGVYGTLSCTHSAIGDASDAYAFTRAVNGAAVPCPSKSPFVPEVAADLPYRTQVIFLGRNNIGTDAGSALIPSDVDALIALQKTIEQRFLIVTPPLGGTLTPGQSTDEGVGTGNYNRVVAYEDWATAKYGDRVIKLRELCFQFGNGGADDNDDIAKGVVPRSLRQDTVHFTYPNGYDKVALLIANEINRRGW